ncbi:MAG: hypothetical protein JWR13_5520 [Mycobacterium sp.]|jgi:hypothetical protein|nr:hypothetical protein [Mycobacterium sp.]MDT5313169.1 hypothetical protein [Mycobacterium sp.]
MDLRLQRIAAWGGIAMLALFFVFFMLIAKLIPPLSPTSSAQQIADFLTANKLRVRVGLALSLLAACVALPFLSTICLRVRRVEGKWGVLSVTQVFAGVIFVPGFLFPMMVLSAAAFRPEQRDPEITQALNDVFWLMFVGIVGTLVVQAVVLTTASFLDRTEPATFPRWFGYLNAWYALLALPGGAVMVFNDGPLAWNGVFAFWIPLVAFSVWMIAVTVVMLQSIGAQQAAERALATAAP